MFSLSGKVAVVTGALGLIGKHHCYALAEAGAHVVVTDLDGGKCREFATNLNPESMGCSVDISDYNSVLELKSLILEKFGHVDILVNNAAINDMFENPALAAEQSKFENYPINLFEKSLKVNITGTVICAQILGTEMAKNSGGSIINIASTYGVVSPDQSLYQNKEGEQLFYKSPAYPTTKGAVLAFTKFLAAYWGDKKVRVNALSPGGVENGQDDFFIEKYSTKTPLKRMAQPSDYKGALVFLASDASAYMTGANLIVDGGFTIW
jgi:NAD(P)-dependent dehydrogenase (short-subunit alcohol dehydrogenase family)